MRQRGGLGVWLAGATLSTLGDSVTAFALAWSAAGHGAGATGAVLTAESVPLCVLILGGGVLADRWGIRRVMIGCDVAMALLMGGCAFVVAVATPVWLLTVVGLLSGTAAALRRPAAGAFPRLFAHDAERDLTRITASVGLSLQVARTAGPALGGLLVSFGGLRLTSTLDAATFALIAVVLLRVRPPGETVPSLRGPQLRSVLDSLVAARRAAGLPAVLVAVAALAASVIPLVMLCVPLAGRERHWSAHATGSVAGAWLVGGVVVTLAVARRGRVHPRLAVAGPLLALAGVAVVAFSAQPWLSAVGIGAVGIGTSLLTARLFPKFVAATPPHMLARFQSLLGLAQTGPLLVALPVLAAVTSRGGLTAGLGVAALLLMLATTAAVRAVDVAPAPLKVPTGPTLGA